MSCAEHKELIQKTVMSVFQIGESDLSVSGGSESYDCLVRLRQSNGFNILPRKDVAEALSKKDLGANATRFLGSASHLLKARVGLVEENEMHSVSVRIRVVTADSGRTLRQGEAMGICPSNLLNQTLNDLLSSARRKMLRLQ